jgi:hypothetical protein
LVVDPVTRDTCKKQAGLSMASSETPPPNAEILEPIGAEPTPRVTNLTFAVREP